MTHAEAIAAIRRLLAEATSTHRHAQPIGAATVSAGAVAHAEAAAAVLAAPTRYALQSSDGYEWQTEDAFSDDTPEQNGKAAFRAYNAFQRVMKAEQNGAAQVRTVCTADPSLDMYDLPALPDPRVTLVMQWPAVPLAQLDEADPDEPGPTDDDDQPAGMIDHDDEDRRAAAEERNARPLPSDY